MLYNPQLETFIRTADAGSFHKAAEQGYVTPTAVMKQINHLESEIGAELFQRTNQGLILTEAGRSLYHDAKNLIRLSNNAVLRRRTPASRFMASSAAC